MRAQIWHVRDLDHVGLLEHALLDGEPGFLALGDVDRGEELVVVLIEDRVALDLREADEQRAPLLRSEQRPEQKPVTETFQPPLPDCMLPALVGQSTMLTSGFMPAAFIASTRNTIESRM